MKNSSNKGLRIGIGLDAHSFAESRQLVLGGIKFPEEPGLAGHSDADVVLHALMDAMLGAIAKGDIGEHFTDKDEQYKDISSIALLVRVQEIIDSQGYELANADITIICEHPRIAPYRDDMVEKISGAIGVDRDRINIKATTTEGMGFTGRGEGIMCQAIVLMSPKQ